MHTRDIAAIFDGRAERYAGDDWHRRYAERLVDVTPLRPGDRVLDAGTGTAFAARAIARRIGPTGYVLAVDLSSGMLTQARRIVAAEPLTNVDLLEADATELHHLPASTFDAVVCAAGLLYMPAEKALSAWHRLLRPDGVVAFSTMKAGSPAAGRIFRECAAGFGLSLADPSEALGTGDRCRAVLEAAGFDRLQVVDARVDFEALDLTLAWEANFKAAGPYGASTLSTDQQAALRHAYFGALAEARETDLAAASRAEVLLAIGHRRAPAAAGGA